MSSPVKFFTNTISFNLKGAGNTIRSSHGCRTCGRVRLSLSALGRSAQEGDVGQESIGREHTGGTIGPILMPRVEIKSILGTILGL